ncbi:hypothetical protein C5167_005793 [Papaver somniferum]|uniref:Ninja-family protein n=1 Tax=Papaver somniferum TaxID=3469 RepID=A0A4Y7JER7_PAPSO|nr:ninja-family protein AFP3-like [Papaver somniferum]RZC58490.1 hypothetical protein C5167_005793 [Papaver somniferum]
MASSSLFFQTRSSVMGERNNENSADIDNEYPKDLLQIFMAGNHFPTEFAAKTEETDDEEIELNLSLGGCFGVNPSEKKRLMRSSSISVSGLSNLFKDEEEGNNSSSAASLIRTCSLPVVVATEEERRKRKELQSLRRLEAKRKRSEKQRNCTRVNNNNNKDSQQEKMQQQQQDNNKLKNGLFSSSSSMPISFRGPNWGSNPALGRSIDINGVPPLPPSPVSVSMNSQASSSSGGSDEIHGRPVPGLKSSFETRSPMNSQSYQEGIEQKPIIPPPPTAPSEKQRTGTDVKMESPSYSPPKATETGSREMGMKMMEEMPCVSTTGNGPNGKRIEGFLYKYRKGEEVRIVCVCHGSFLTPAEFVKHAGGIDVTHPLRHITVSQTPSF